MSTPAWSVSTLNILSALNKMPVVDGVPLTDLKYTVLDDEKVVYRGVEELAELHLIDPKKPPKEYASFRPERLALHETIVALSTQIKLTDEMDMQAKTKVVYNSVRADLSSLNLDKLRDDTEDKVAKLVTDYLEGVDIGASGDAVKIKSICDQVHDLPVEAFGQFKKGYTPKDAMIARATDVLFTEVAKTQIAALVDSKIKANHTLEPFDIPSADERITYMVSGGQASGKGSSVAALQKWAETDHVGWGNIAKINTDSYKSLLLEPGSVKPEYYSQLAQEEASMMSQQINNRLNQMALLGQAPHIFIDQVFVGPTQIELGLLNGGKVKGIIVSTDVADAVERSYARGKADGEKGRFENTEGILRCHKMMTQQVPSTLSKFMGENVQFSLFDNNVPQGTQPIEVADIDLLKKTIVVHSNPSLERFSQKGKINEKATSAGDLYSGVGDSAEVYLQPLVINGGCHVDHGPVVDDNTSTLSHS